MPRDDATRARLLPGDYAQVLSAGVLAAYVLVVALGLFLRTSLIPENMLGGNGFVAAALLAAAACLVAAHLLPRPLDRPWLAFALAALFATIYATAACALFLVGLVLLIQQAEHGRWLELLLDTAVLIAATCALVLRWAPSLDSFDVAAADVSALSAAILTLTLISSRPISLPRWSLYGLAGATVSLLLSTSPQIFADSAATRASASLGMWVFLMFAGVSALRSDVSSVVAPRRDRLRLWIAPVGVLVLVALFVEAAFNPAMERRAAFALAVLSVFVGARMLQLLYVTRSQLAQQRELAHTRALMAVNRALAGTNDLDTTLRTVTDWARRVLHARAAAIELLTHDGRQLVLQAVTGLPESVIGMTYSVDNSFTGQVVRDREVRLSVNAARDPAFAPQSSFLGPHSVAAVPLLYRERIVGVLACTGTRPFEAADIELLCSFANQAALAIEDARLFEQVRTLSVTDALTGLANRRHLDRELSREFAAAKRGRRLVAIMFDLDDFKEHNDRYGHMAGDRALKHFADALRGETRAMNLAARYGGDEFFVLLGEADRKGAELVIERVRARFEKAMRETGNAELTISAGVAEFQPDMESAAELVEAADRALYISKSGAGTSK
ncbi:MAG TPA: sensor domain-containing diguanylate cyclase [Longimicrobiales bacterium]|nr:sensor domain-containing diguanylate cyclase [Longimicrobiales bacterium]